MSDAEPGQYPRYSVDHDESGWYVIEQTSPEAFSVGGPFPTRAFAREVETGACMMRDRRAEAVHG